MPVLAATYGFGDSLMAGALGARLSWVLGFLLLLGGSGLTVQGQSGSPAEYKIKAAYLFNFLKYIEWPTSTVSPEQPYVIGILGEDPFGVLLDGGLAGRKINDQPVVVKRGKRVADLVDCQIVFIARSEKERLREVIEALAGKSILTVSELERFTREGGMIRFEVEKDQVQCEVNLDAVKDAGLQVSSKLLAISKVVKSAKANQ